MKALLHILTLAALLAMWIGTIYAIAGPHPLPARISVHFDAAGNPNGWGTPAMLWLLPGLATLVYGLMTLVARFPAAFSFPVRVTPRNRPRLESLALGMIAWLRAETVCLFASIQYVTVQLARRGSGSLPPWFLPLTLGVIFATIIGHVRAMLRTDPAGK